MQVSKFCLEKVRKKTLGLGLLKGEFKLLKNKDNSLHVGWNSCEIKKNKILKE